MKKVNILMPTYNGEKYIREQLDSLINQTYRNIDIYIRDDGSTDNTVEIIKEYCNKNISGIKFILVDSDGKNLGYPDCFWELVKKSDDADYYSFCDQDDYWEPTKIETCVTHLEKVDNTKPAMCFCRFDYYDGNMKYIRDGENYAGVNFTFKQGMYYTFAPGFTQIVNRSLIENLNIDYIYGKKVAHDLWCQWIATALGTVIFEPGIQAKYRRHEAAVTSGNKNIISSIKEWWKKEINGTSMIVWTNCLNYFFELYGNQLEFRDRNIFSIFVNSKNTIFTTLRKTFHLGRFRPSIGGELALRILFLLRKC